MEGQISFQTHTFVISLPLRIMALREWVIDLNRVIASVKMYPQSIQIVKTSRKVYSALEGLVKKIFIQKTTLVMID